MQEGEVHKIYGWFHEFRATHSFIKKDTYEKYSTGYVFTKNIKGKNSEHNRINQLTPDCEQNKIIIIFPSALSRLQNFQRVVMAVWACLQ